MTHGSTALRGNALVDDTWDQSIGAVEISSDGGATYPQLGASQEPPIGQSVSLLGVDRSFGSREVLKGLDLNVPAGQFLAIVGRSGGGKSTLMRLVVGLDKPNAGEIAIDEAPVRSLQSSVRLLFQDPRLLPWKRVLANVGIARGRDWKSIARAALNDVGLAERERDWPAVLSGGQRQRVALARVLVSRPGVLLLDEPFGALDALTRAEMHELLDRLWQTYGFTILLITHDVAEAVALADRVVVLRDGRVALDQSIDVARSRRNGNEPELMRLRDQILAQV